MEIYTRIKRDLYFDESLQAFMIYGDELWHNLIQNSYRNKGYSVYTLWESDDPTHTCLRITENTYSIAHKHP